MYGALRPRSAAAAADSLLTCFKFALEAAMSWLSA
jgi:hypothetical protein